MGGGKDDEGDRAKNKRWGAAHSPLHLLRRCHPFSVAGVLCRGASDNPLANATISGVGKRRRPPQTLPVHVGLAVTNIFWTYEPDEIQGFPG